MYTPDSAYANLPDPERQAAFYEGVTIKRGIAWVIDLVIIMVLVIPALIMTAFIGIFFLPLLYLGVGFAYRWVTIGTGSATLGMRVMAIEFRDMNGHRLDMGQAFFHTLGFTIAISTMALQVLSIFMMFSTPRGQGIPDMVLGVVALNRRAN